MMPGLIEEVSAPPFDQRKKFFFHGWKCSVSFVGRMPDETQAPEPGGRERLVRGSDIHAFVFGSVIFGVVIGCGVLNILAAKGGWNPFHWQGRLWTGVF